MVRIAGKPRKVRNSIDDGGRATAPSARPIRFGNLYSVEIAWPGGRTERVWNAFYYEWSTAALAARSMNFAWRARG